MTTEKKRYVTVVFCNACFLIPFWSIALWAFSDNRYLVHYWVVSVTGAVLSAVLLIFRRDSIFWYFVAFAAGAFTSIVYGLSLVTGTLLILAFKNRLPSGFIMVSTLLVYAVYLVFPLKYYLNDYYRTEKDRLKAFDFDEGTYNIKESSITRSDAFADYYFESLLSKTHYGLMRLYLLFPIGGGAIAIIAGKISKNFQLGLGIISVILTNILFIQMYAPVIVNILQVHRLEKRYGKKIMIDWGEEEE